MRNFIFINTIVPNSKWIQYGFFQQSSNLYDVKIDGFNRYFICSLKAIVKNSGIIRTPPQDWITHLCRQYGNKNMEGIETFADSIIANNLIKIPDSYEVELKFNSLLPDNYNTFLFNYYNNISIAKNLKVYRDSIVNNFTTKGIEYMGAVFKYFWNNPIDTKTIDNSSK